MNHTFRKLLIAATAVLSSPAQSNDAALIAKAKGIHERVLKLDTHNDIEPANFTPDCNYTMRLTTQVNIPKMVEGGMDVSFMIVYVGQGPLTPEGYDNAYRQAVAKFDAVHRLTEKIAPDSIGLALTPADVLALAQEAPSNRRHRRGERISHRAPISRRVKEFYDRGGRYMSLAHNGNSQLADSNTGETQGYLYNNGLSPLGREVIAEMNRLGMMVDLSHPSKGANMEAMRLSKAPVIASHSGVRALADVSRNMDDEQLLALKKNGGVIQVVGFASYVKTDSKERIDALAKLREEFGLTQGADAARRRSAAAGAADEATASTRPGLPGRERRGSCRAGPCEAEAAAGGEEMPALDALSPERRARIRQAAGGDRREVAACRPSQREGLRESHRLRGEAHRNRSRGNFVGLRRRRRNRRLEQRGGSIQRHAGTGSPRLHRRTDRKVVERQSASSLGRSREGRAKAAATDAAEGGAMWRTTLLAVGLPLLAQAADFTVGSATAHSGQKATGYIAVPAGVDAASNIPVIVVNGAKPGPVLALVAGSHGTEYASILALQKLAQVGRPGGAFRGR